MPQPCTFNPDNFSDWRVETANAAWLFPKEKATFCIGMLLRKNEKGAKR
jgi:hypothetical protein